MARDEVFICLAQGRGSTLANVLVQTVETVEGKWTNRNDSRRAQSHCVKTGQGKVRRILVVACRRVRAEIIQATIAVVDIARRIG